MRNTKRDAIENIICIILAIGLLVFAFYETFFGDFGGALF